MDAIKTETAQKPQLDKPLRLLRPLLRPYTWPLIGSVFAILVSSGTLLAIGWGLKTIVDNGFADASGDILNRALLGLLVVVLLMAGASYARLNLMYKMAERITADLRQKIYAHLMTLNPEFFEQHKTGDHVSRINADTTILQLVMTSNVPSAMRHFLMMMGGVIMLCIVSPEMTGVLLVAVPLVVGPVIYFGKKVRAKSLATQSSVGDMGAYAQESLQGIQTIQSFGYEETAKKSFNHLADTAFLQAKEYIGMRAFLTAFVIAVIFGAIGLVLWFGGHRVLTGDMTTGDLSAFIFYAATVAGAVMALSEAMTDFARASGAADRILELLGTNPSLKSQYVGASMQVTTEGGIVFEDVNFAYPTRPDDQALKNISFDIPSGKMTALVGPSGAGKTTVFQLLQRFYDPQSGRILIDNVDIGNFDPESVRENFGVVSQDPVIFSMSVADNIRLARPDATDADVFKAAKKAQAHDFIEALPDGYSTLVGERGNRLSGGQRQRLAIARAILKDPKILLLDEATSALDSVNEQAVYAGLKELMQGRTVLVIAHRLSTVQDADYILVMDEGRLVASGTHDELYDTDKLYTHLAKLQMSVG